MDLTLSNSTADRYHWYYSTDNENWYQAYDGETTRYNNFELQESTWFRVHAVKTGCDPVWTDPVKVNMFPKMENMIQHDTIMFYNSAKFSSSYYYYVYHYKTCHGKRQDGVDYRPAREVHYH